MTFIIIGVVLMAVGAGLTLSALGVMGLRDPSQPKPAPNMPLLGLGLLADLAGAGALVYGALGLGA